VQDGNGLFYCQQIIACPSSKIFVKALTIGFSWFIRIYPGCSIAFCRLVYTTSKHLTQVVCDFSFNFKSTYACPASS